MKVSVIIPSKNGFHHLQECLPTVLRAASLAPMEVQVIVVDDNSTDQTVDNISAMFPTIQVLQNPNKGVCSARNFGVRNTSCDWICFLDNDVFLEETFFQTIQKYLNQKVFCITCADYAAYPIHPSKEEQLDGVKLLQWKRGFPRFTGNVYNDKLPSSSEYPSWGVQGACFLCNRSKFNMLGGFETLFDPYLLEETELVYRGLKRGWKIIYAPDTKPRHKCGGTINSKKSKRTRYLSKRNRILFIWKNIHSFRLLFFHFSWLFLRLSPRILLECCKLKATIRRKEKCMVSDLALLKESQNYYLKTIKNFKEF